MLYCMYYELQVVYVRTLHMLILLTACFAIFATESMHYH